MSTNKITNTKFKTSSGRTIPIQFDSVNEKIRFLTENNGKTSWVSFSEIERGKNFEKALEEQYNRLVGHNSKVDYSTNELFDIYNLKPNKHKGHRFDSNWYGPSPVFKDSSFQFVPRDGSTGYIPDPRVHPNFDSLVGVPFDEVTKIRTKSFKISYTYAMPRDKPLDGKMKMLILLHGVPTQKNQKFEVMRELSNFMFCVAPDMFGMGESDQPHEYKSPLNDEENQKWDWHHDIDWVDQLITHLKEEFPVFAKAEPIFQADDWGGGIAVHYAAASGAGKFEMDGRSYSLENKISQLILVNPIALDGYYVREIGAIGRTSVLNGGQFSSAMGGFDQTAVQIEKLMIDDKSRMNNYTERDFLGQYCDTNYQSGRSAVEQGIHFWNVKTLADRSSRLAPRQLQPSHEDKEGRKKWGVKYQDIKVPSVLIWGTKDQMMPPTQMDRLYYLLSLNHQSCIINEIDGADHFCEWDRPDAVARCMIRGIRTQLGPSAVPVFLGNDPKAVYKGDEEVMVRELQRYLF